MFIFVLKKITVKCVQNLHKKYISAQENIRSNEFKLLNSMEKHFLKLPHLIQEKSRGTGTLSMPCKLTPIPEVLHKNKKLHV